MEVSSFVTEPLHSRTKHFTSVMPPSSHSSEAAQGQWFGSGIRTPGGQRTVVMANCPIFPGYLFQLTLTNDISSLTLENEVSYSKCALHSKINIQLRLSVSTKAGGAAALSCVGFQPVKHSFTVGMWTRTPEVSLMSVYIWKEGQQL